MSRAATVLLPPMTVPTVLLLLVLAAVLADGVLRLRRRHRAVALLAELALPREGAPELDLPHRHVGPSGASLIAADATGRTVHLAVRHGARIDSVRLPTAHLESVSVLEDGHDIGDDGSGDGRGDGCAGGEGGATAGSGRTVGSVTLRIAVADERRSLYDIAFLERPALRGSARQHRAVEACRAWASLLSGARDEVSEGEVEERVPPSVPGDGACPAGPGWAQVALAAGLCVAALMPLAVSRLPAPDTPAVAAALPAERPELATPADRARAFERDLPLLSERLDALGAASRLDGENVRLERLDARRAELERLVAAAERGRDLPLDAAPARRSDALATRAADLLRAQLPAHRRAFARATRFGADRIGAWTVGEDDRTLRLARGDFADVQVRAAAWASIAEEARRLRFERVEFRRFRSGDPIDSLALDS